MISTIEWGSVPDWVQAFGVIIGFFFAIWQMRKATDQAMHDALASKVSAYFAIVDHLQSEHVRAARYRVRHNGRQYSQWSKDEQEDAQLVATSFDIAAAALRYGAFDLNQFARVWENSVLELAPIVAPHVESRRQEANSKGLSSDGSFDNFLWLVESLKKRQSRNT